MCIIIVNVTGGLDKLQLIYGMGEKLHPNRLFICDYLFMP